MILKSQPMTCSVDPIPSSLCVDCLDHFLSTLTQIVDDSLLSGSFPSVFKHAVGKSLLKKPTLDHNNLKNYRPVSNLLFLSKLIKKIVLQQLFAYLNSHDLLCPSSLLTVHVTALRRLYSKLLTIFCVLRKMVMCPSWPFLIWLLLSILSTTVFSYADFNLSMAFLAQFFRGLSLTLLVGLRL